MDFDMEEEVVEQDDMSEPMTGIEKVADSLRDIAMVLYKVNPTIMPYKMAKAMYDRLPDISKQHVDDTGRRMTEPEEDEITGSPDSMSETMIMVEGKKDGGKMKVGPKGEEETMEEEVVEQDDMSEPMTGVEKVADSLRDICLLYTSPSPRDRQKSRMPSSA